MNPRSPLFSGRRRLRRVAITGAAASTLALGMSALPSAIPAAQAVAIPIPLSCNLNAHYLCTWQNSNYTSTQWNFPEFGSQHTNGFWWYVGDAPNDKISSLYNATQSWGFVAKD